MDQINDRFQKELDECCRFAKQARHADDREFWQTAAKRWKTLIELYERPDKPDKSDDRVTRRMTRFSRRPEAFT